MAWVILSTSGFLAGALVYRKDSKAARKLLLYWGIALFYGASGYFLGKL